MSGYKGHVIGGLVAYGLLLLLLSPYYVPTPLRALEWMMAAVLGSLFPDIDIKSKGQALFYWICAALLFVFCMHRLYVSCVAVALCAIMPPLCRHRGITHRIWFLLLLSTGAAWSLSTVFPTMQQAICLNILFFFVGTLSHLYLDFGVKRMIRW